MYTRRRAGLESLCGPGSRIGGTLSDLERHDENRRPENDAGNPYLFLALGVGLAIAAAMIVSTAGVAAAGLPFVIGAAALFGLGVSRMRGRAVQPPVSKERELLSAIRANGGSITPTEAAMETSLTVREADGMLSELAGGGHLAVESRNGALFYALPGRGGEEIEG